jgi:putative ATP-dependent endonuclease of OLD family
MYISKIEIKNFRNFASAAFEFNEGTNVIIGHNNAGKTNLIKALGLVFDSRNRRRLNIDDFCRYIDVSQYFELDNNGDLAKQAPPKIEISITIKESTGDDADNELQDDTRVIFDWRTEVGPPYEARLTYSFFLPEGSETKAYVEAIKSLKKDGKNTPDEYWNLLRRDFIRKYIARIFCGNETEQRRVDSDDLAKFDFQFLDAIRDVEKQMFSGGNELLKDVLTFFLDDDLRHNFDLNDQLKEQQRLQRRSKFQGSSGELISGVIQRINKDPILEYASEVGASIGGKPDFEGELAEEDLFSVLRLMIAGESSRIPVTLNGLGYNNLIFMSILLSKMQLSASDYLSPDEQKVFPMLVIEEPEAHLHPSMQFKFLKFLKKNLREKKQVRQIFITTHSTHITAAVELDEIICLNITDDNKLNVAYPGRVFDPANEEDKKSKAYVKRFLDATKSDMLFAKRVIFVEGIAEQLLMNCLAAYNARSLEDAHVSIVNVGGRYFKHFLRLFDYDENDQLKKFALNKKVSCVLDADPSKKSKDGNSRWGSCFPYEIGQDIETYEYKPISTELDELIKGYQNQPNIKIFGNINGEGKTFEYELAFANPSCRLLLTEHLSKVDVLEALMHTYQEGGTVQSMLEMIDDEILEAAILESQWEDEKKKRAIIASRYLKSVETGPGKGEHALFLDYGLRQNLIEEDPINFIVPDYIRDSIEYVCT